MRVLDLFSGTGSSTQAFEDRGHFVFTVELDPQFNPSLVANVLSLHPEQFAGMNFDFIWASPPCTCFSIASCGHYWTKVGDTFEPKKLASMDAHKLVAWTRTLIQTIAPKAWVMENPRGLLRKMPAVAGLPRETVTYCQYGDIRMKPTDLFGYPPPTWVPRPMCKNGDSCHEASPRGDSKGGTQGLKNATERARVPYELSMDLCLAMEEYLKG